MRDERTPNLALPLPSKGNLLEEDVVRLRDALTALDTAVIARATPADITAALSTVVDAAPATLDTLRELASAIANNPNYAADIAKNIADIRAQIAHIEQSQVNIRNLTALVYAGL